MTQFSPTVREDINNGVGQRLASDMQSFLGGDLLGFLIRGLTATEAAAAVTANVKALANAASMIFHIQATAGTYTGPVRLLLGDSSVSPGPGEAVWQPGQLNVRFNAADAITAASFWYARVDQVNSFASCLERKLGQQP